MNSVITGILLSALRMTDFTQKERLNIWWGKMMVDKTDIVYDTFSYFDMTQMVPSLEIPAYFFGGVNDYTVSYPLQKEYYEALDAPLKAFYTFENSVHSPLYEESDHPENFVPFLLFKDAVEQYNQETGRVVTKEELERDLTVLWSHVHGLVAIASMKMSPGIKTGAMNWSVSSISDEIRYWSLCR